MPEESFVADGYNSTSQRGLLNDKGTSDEDVVPLLVWENSQQTGGLNDTWKKWEVLCAFCCPALDGCTTTAAVWWKLAARWLPVPPVPFINHLQGPVQSLQRGRSPPSLPINKVSHPTGGTLCLYGCLCVYFAGFPPLATASILTPGEWQQAAPTHLNTIIPIRNQTLMRVQVTIRLIYLNCVSLICDTWHDACFPDEYTK